MSSKPAITSQVQEDLDERLLVAVRTGELESARALLEKGANAEAQNSKGFSVLYIAAYNNLIGITTLLIDYGADVNGKSSQGETALHGAAWKGYVEIATILLNREAKVDARQKILDLTPLHCASIGGHTKLVAFLLAKGASIEAKEENGNTALHKSVAHKDTAVFLIDMGADVFAKNKDKDTPLHSAARQGNTDVATLLLSNGAKVDTQDKWGKTPLYYATDYGHTALVDLLCTFPRMKEIEEGAPLTEAELANPALVFLHAVATKNVTLLKNVLIHPELVEGDEGYVSPESSEPAYDTVGFIAAKAAKNKQAILEHKFTGARTALHVLASHIIPESADGREVEDAATILVRSSGGVPVDTKDATGKTAFQKAVIAGNVGTLEHLIHLGANPNETFMLAGKSVSPLEYLAQTNQPVLFETLVNILEAQGKLAEAVTIVGAQFIKFAAENSLEDSLGKIIEIKAKLDESRLAESASGDACAGFHAAASAEPLTGGGASTKYPFGFQEGLSALAGADAPKSDAV